MTCHPSSLCDAECLRVGSHYTVSATFTPSSPNSIWSFHTKNNIKIHVYGRDGCQREENSLTKGLMTILIAFCKPGSTLFKELHSWLSKVGEKVPNLRRLSNIHIKAFSAMQVERQVGSFCVFQAPISSVAWVKADERVQQVTYARKATEDLPKGRFCTFILRPQEVSLSSQTSLMCMVHIHLKAWLAALPFQTVSTCLQGRKEL